jgi:outer membrane protein OmpA-like peptidoglycan-associated protein
MNRIAILALGLVVGLMLAVPGRAASPDVDLERLTRSLAQLSADTRLGTYAAAEIARAQAALNVLKESGRGKKRAHLLYLAERRVDIAWASAQVLDFENQLTELQREHSRLQLLAARQEAERARRELDQQRMIAQIRAEEAERAAEEARLRGDQETAAAQELAEQARRLANAQAEEAALARKEAELSAAAADALRTRLDSLTATRGTRGMQMTLDDVAFAPGQSKLLPEARASIDKVADFIREAPGKRVRIEGHTDSTGSANANQVLSQRRAEAVREALVAAGIEASRMSAVGIGADRPIAGNDSAEGRARNRRVDVIIEDNQ